MAICDPLQPLAHLMYVYVYGSQSVPLFPLHFPISLLIEVMLDHTHGVYTANLSDEDRQTNENNNCGSGQQICSLDTGVWFFKKLNSSKQLTFPAKIPCNKEQCNFTFCFDPLPVHWIDALMSLEHGKSNIGQCQSERITALFAFLWNLSVS